MTHGGKSVLSYRVHRTCVVAVNDGICTYANPALQPQTGLSLGQLEQQDWLKFALHDHREAAKTLWKPGPIVCNAILRVAAPMIAKTFALCASQIARHRQLFGSRFMASRVLKCHPEALRIRLIRMMMSGCLEKKINSRSGAPLRWRWRG